MFEDKLIEAGCDWITASTADQTTGETMWSFWKSMQRHYGISGNWIRKASWQGYAGERIEHGFSGWREDGWLIMLSGPLALAHAREAIDIGMRPSRLDLQTTLSLHQDPSQVLQQAFTEAKAYKPANGRLPELKMFVGRNAIEGFYVGKRTSEVLLRAYDKGLESKKPEYDHCVRFEVELKRATAQRYALAWLDHVADEDWVDGAVHALYKARGMRLPFKPGEEGVVLRKTSYVSSTEAKAAWIRNQVSPTIQALVDEIGWSSVVQLLFPDSLTKQQDCGRMTEAL